MNNSPSLCRSVGSMETSIYGKLGELCEEAAQNNETVFTFHLGDTYLPPPFKSRLGELRFSSEHDPQLYEYSPTQGDAELRMLLVDKVQNQNNISIDGPENIQITCGASHGLASAVGAVCDAGDEVLLLTPYWPLIRGMVSSFGAHPIEVPFTQDMRQESFDLGELLEGYLTDKTKAIYVANPNNPDGKVLTQQELDSIGNFATKQNLWILSDEAYEHYVYDNQKHISIGSKYGDRTITAFSFSKTYAQAGIRVGYVVGSQQAIEGVQKIVAHSVYCVSRAMQYAAKEALIHGDDFIDEARHHYITARNNAYAQIEIPCIKPQGSTYLFLDLKNYLKQGQTSRDVLDLFAKERVILAPGDIFGKHFTKSVRLCYTAVLPKHLEEGIERVNDVCDKLKSSR